MRPTADTPSRTVTLRRPLPAAREDAFKAWTEPDAIAQWFGTPGTEVLEAEVDLRVGGGYRLLVSGVGETGELVGTYLEVEAPERLVYTWRWQWPGRRPMRESVVTVEFRELGERSEIFLTHEGLASEHSVEFHTNGWNASLEGFVELLG
jgi:uncharacterized protein YndB with AHSA1/START domain